MWQNKVNLHIDVVLVTPPLMLKSARRTKMSKTKEQEEEERIQKQSFQPPFFKAEESIYTWVRFRVLRFGGRSRTENKSNQAGRELQGLSKSRATKPNRPGSDRGQGLPFSPLGPNFSLTPWVSAVLTQSIFSIFEMVQNYL